VNIYVGNLPYQMTDDDLRQTFEAYGEVRAASILIDRETGRSRGFGFVEMDDEDGARAIAEVNGKQVMGRTLTVNEARPRAAGGAPGGGGGGYRGAGGGGFAGGAPRGAGDERRPAGDSGDSRPAGERGPNRNFTRDAPPRRTGGFENRDEERRRRVMDRERERKDTKNARWDEGEDLDEA
jgi:RNA recognition motif-containing protein